MEDEEQHPRGLGLDELYSPTKSSRTAARDSPHPQSSSGSILEDNFELFPSGLDSASCNFFDIDYSFATPVDGGALPPVVAPLPLASSMTFAQPRAMAEPGFSVGGARAGLGASLGPGAGGGGAGGAAAGAGAAAAAASSSAVAIGAVGGGASGRTGLLVAPGAHASDSSMDAFDLPTPRRPVRVHVLPDPPTTPLLVSKAAPMGPMHTPGDSARKVSVRGRFHASPFVSPAGSRSSGTRARAAVGAGRGGGAAAAAASNGSSREDLEEEEEEDEEDEEDEEGEEFGGRRDGEEGGDEDDEEWTTDSAKKSGRKSGGRKGGASAAARGVRAGANGAGAAALAAAAALAVAADFAGDVAGAGGGGGGAAAAAAAVGGSGGGVPTPVSARRSHRPPVTRLQDLNSPRSPRTPQLKPLPKLDSSSRPSSAPSKMGMLRLPLASPRAKSPQVPMTQWVRQEYSPCFRCTKGHVLCERRMALGLHNLKRGLYVVDGMEEPVQACYADDIPCLRGDLVEDGVVGQCALTQLHILRTYAMGSAARRPLLFPDISSLAQSPPFRMVASSKFFCGQFFQPTGACQRERCILICFPKMHRGSVRLQIKVHQPGKEGEEHDDVKVHFLSYVMWLFGVGDYAAAELNKWPSVEGRCGFSRLQSGKFGNDEFLCINPFHYRGAGDAEEPDALSARIEKEIQTCVRALPPLPGERALGTGANRCFCGACQKIASQ